VQFKEKFSSGKQMAEEMAAFANSKGGLIIFGVKDKTGEIMGLTYEQIQHISSELGNVANDQVRPIVYLHTDVC
jgi:predicted HTH transcriptional regulator